MYPVLALAAGLFFAASAQATEMIPVGYVFDQATGTGTYTYHDETGHQLTDGVYGTNDYSANLGHGAAYEWVGWVYKPLVNIDFDFGVATTIDRILIGSMQDNPVDVVLPNVSLYSSSNGSSWNLVTALLMPESNAYDNLHHTFEFDNLALSSRYIRVALSHSFDGPWTFTDEIDFHQNAASVPEPAAPLLLLAGLAALGLSRRR